MYAIWKKLVFLIFELNYIVRIFLFKCFKAISYNKIQDEKTEVLLLFVVNGFVPSIEIKCKSKWRQCCSPNESMENMNMYFDLGI